MHTLTSRFSFQIDLGWLHGTGFTNDWRIPNGEADFSTASTGGGLGGYIDWRILEAKFRLLHHSPHHVRIRVDIILTRRVQERMSRWLPQQAAISEQSVTMIPAKSTQSTVQGRTRAHSQPPPPRRHCGARMRA